MRQQTDYCKSGLDVIEQEAQAILRLGRQLDKEFNNACDLILKCQGKVIVTGIGKSGHIGNKIAATFASTGTGAFFIHPAEASHGDLGMVRSDDVVIIISNSGYTSELLVLLPSLKKLGVSIIALCGDKNSPLAKASLITLDVSISEEACPLGLAPTTSTTVALVMGDALAIAILKARGFQTNDFAFSHPGGSLGKRLLLSVNDISHKDEQLPVVHENLGVREALIEVTTKKLGMTCVVNDNGELKGVYTDGDIRRTLTGKYDINNTLIKEVMTQTSLTVSKDLLASKALEIMNNKKITSLVIVENLKPAGIVHMHDLIKAGIY